MSVEETLLGPQERKYRAVATWVSLVVGLLLMGAKFWAFGFTGSQAVFSDALESIVNVIAAGLALFVVAYSAKPADRDHPYGHGKIEYFSAAFEGGLITFAAFFIMVESVRAILSGRTPTNLDVGIGVVLAAGVANLILGLFLMRAGKKHHSIALKASGHHVISDFWTSAGVAIGLVLVYFTGFVWIDSVIAFVVAGLLARTGLKLVRESVGGLMDEEDLGILKSLREVLAEYAEGGIIQIHNVKVIRSGWYHHIDAHVVLPEHWTVSETHGQMVRFENNVIKHYEYSGEMNFHVDPCRQSYCQVCDLEDCPIRNEDFIERMPVKLEHLRSEEEPAEYR